MGIYDRDYYRREGPSYLDSFSLRGQVCKWLLITNIAVFILQLITRDAHGAGGPVTDALVLIPQKVLAGEVWRLLTYAFLHDPNTVWHILFNMWMLWMFGGYVEDLYGRWEFLAFYLISAALGGVAYMTQAALGWGLPMNSSCLGASGAITAVMILCALHYPNLTILLFFVLPVPIWILAIFQVIQDSFGLLSRSGEGIAFSVHLGGAAFAALYYKAQVRLLSFWPRFRSWKAQKARPRLRVFHGDEEPREPVPVPAPPLADVDEQLEAKLDAVLEKVQRSGQGSLTESEKQILLRASEIYKKRRS